MMVTTPIRKKEEIELMKNHYLRAHEYRNYTLFVVGINTALRISDLLKLRWEDVYDFDRNIYYLHIYIVEQKTHKQTCIALNDSCINAFSLLKADSNPVSSKEYIFSPHNDRYRHISRNRAYNIIKKAAVQNHIDGNVSCHSLRKTFGYHAWKQGTPPILIMNIYNHSNFEITKRYLSIDQEERDELFNSINL